MSHSHLEILNHGGDPGANPGPSEIEKVTGLGRTLEVGP